MDKQINIRETLDWYLWAGVNETCGDLPCLINDTEKFFSSSDVKRIPSQTTLSEQTNESLSTRAKTPVSAITQNFVPAAQITQPFATVTKNVREICAKASSLDE